MEEKAKQAIDEMVVAGTHDPTILPWIAGFAAARGALADLQKEAQPQ